MMALVIGISALAVSGVGPASADGTTEHLTEMFSLDSENEAAEYQEGGENTKIHKILGPVR